MLGPQSCITWVLPSTGPGNQMQVFWKISKCSYPLSYLSRPWNWYFDSSSAGSLVTASWGLLIQCKWEGCVQGRSAIVPAAHRFMCVQTVGIRDSTWLYFNWFRWFDPKIEQATRVERVQFPMCTHRCMWEHPSHQCDISIDRCLVSSIVLVQHP